MTQISKNVMYSGSTNTTLDELFLEVFGDADIDMLANIKPTNYFYYEIVPIIRSLSKQKLLNIRSSLPLKQSQRLLYFNHLISGGGGSIFQYRDLIFKITPRDRVIASEKDIQEVAIPKYISKLLEINNYITLSSFVLIPLYVRYGDFGREFKALTNMYSLSILMIAYTKLDHLHKVITKESLQAEVLRLRSDEKNSNDRITQINIMIMNSHINSRIMMINNLSSFNVIRETKTNYGYITIADSAIMSCNKLSALSLSNYFNDESIDYNVLLQTLSLQLIFQLLIFYHTLIKMKPSFAHRDLKLDNILLTVLNSHNIKQDIIIGEETYKVNINSPLIFKINDFERSKIDSQTLWNEDFKYLVVSIKYYKNLILPEELVNKLENINYSDLEKLILSETFKPFITKA